jgi:hypothetical protein
MNGIPGFLIAADAITACRACGAAVGKPCFDTERTLRKKSKERPPLKPGCVHFSRRIARLLMTGSATAAERERIESELVDLLREDLKRAAWARRGR